MNNPYTNLKFYHERHVYKRGRFQGDAPFDKRSATHKRVLAPTSDKIEVLMHRTVILTAYATGEIRLNTDGWHESPTTREAMSLALHRAGLHAGMYSNRVGNLSQTALRISGQGTWRYYDGMRFDADGRLLSTAYPWQAKVADREARKAKREELKPLLEVLPILHAGIAEAGATGPARAINAYSPDKPELWPDIVRWYTYRLSVGWRPITDWRVVRQRILRAATERLVKIVDREA